MTVVLTVVVAVTVAEVQVGDRTPAAGKPMNPTRKVKAPVPAVMSAAIAVQCSGVFLELDALGGADGGEEGGGDGGGGGKDMTTPIRHT